MGSVKLLHEKNSNMHSKNYQLSLENKLGNSSMVHLMDSKNAVQMAGWETQKETVKIKHAMVTRDKILPELEGNLFELADAWLVENCGVCNTINPATRAGTLTSFTADDADEILPKSITRKLRANDKKNYFRIDVQNPLRDGRFNIQFQVSNNSYACIVFPITAAAEAPEKLLQSFREHKQFVYT